MQLWRGVMCAVGHSRLRLAAPDPRHTNDDTMRSERNTETATRMEEADTIATLAYSQHDATPSSSSMLYAHALESIFAFLSLQELAGILQVCKQWSRAVATMRPLLATHSDPC